jgi:hypothetical protein
MATMFVTQIRKKKKREEKHSLTGNNNKNAENQNQLHVNTTNETSVVECEPSLNV